MYDRNKFCECGRAATVKVNGITICQRCYDLDHAPDTRRSQSRQSDSAENESTFNPTPVPMLVGADGFAGGRNGWQKLEHAADKWLASRGISLAGTW